MCVIVEKPAGIELPLSLISSCIQPNNPDGWGFMWHEQEKNYWRKGVSFETFKEVYENHEFLKNYRVFYHFRKNTAGKSTLRNTHPLKIGKTDVLMMHNGTMPNVWATDGDSDTYIFSQMIKDVVEENPYLLNSLGFRRLMMEAIGKGGTVVFLLPDGTTQTVGSLQWESAHDCRFSNIRSWKWYE